jgi:hypothetical protein
MTMTSPGLFSTPPGSTMLDRLCIGLFKVILCVLIDQPVPAKSFGQRYLGFLAQQLPFDRLALHALERSQGLVDVVPSAFAKTLFLLLMDLGGRLVRWQGREFWISLQQRLADFNFTVHLVMLIPLVESFAENIQRVYLIAFVHSAKMFNYVFLVASDDGATRMED